MEMITLLQSLWHHKHADKMCAITLTASKLRQKFHTTLHDLNQIFIVL